MMTAIMISTCGVSSWNKLSICYNCNYANVLPACNGSAAVSFYIHMTDGSTFRWYLEANNEQVWSYGGPHTEYLCIGNYPIILSPDYTNEFYMQCYNTIEHCDFQWGYNSECYAYPEATGFYELEAVTTATCMDLIAPYQYRLNWAQTQTFVSYGNVDVFAAYVSTQEGEFDQVLFTARVGEATGSTSRASYTIYSEPPVLSVDMTISGYNCGYNYTYRA